MYCIFILYTQNSVDISSIYTYKGSRDSAISIQTLTRTQYQGEDGLKHKVISTKFVYAKVIILIGTYYIITKWQLITRQICDNEFSWELHSSINLRE